MQVHSGLQHGVVLAFATDRRNYDWFRSAAAGQTFLDRMSESGMRTEFQPNVDTGIRDGVDRWRELNRFPDTAAPMRCVSSGTVKTATGNRAEERNATRLRGQAGQRVLQG